jgi:hypothetical protein
MPENWWAFFLFSLLTWMLNSTYRHPNRKLELAAPFNSNYQYLAQALSNSSYQYLPQQNVNLVLTANFNEAEPDFVLA